jgi:hypothetical protein
MALNARRLHRCLLTLVAVAAAVLGSEAQGGFAAPPGRQKVRTIHSAAEFAAMTGGRVRIERGLDPQRHVELRMSLARPPVASFTVIAPQSPSVTWVGTRHGAFRVVESTARDYFAGRRWLPDDHVTGIGFEGDAVWVETKTGFARIVEVPLTLAAKSRAFVERVQARHNRWGLTAASQLVTPGDLSTNRMVSSDNDGLWTAMYVAAEAFRFRVTGEADARENARRGMQAILRLEAITGRPGFPARSFIRTGVDLQPDGGEWHDTPDGQWRWKGDTSSDEIVGHYFVYPIYHDLVADAAEKPALQAAIARITRHILDNDYQLIDVDGRPTRWGWWGPARIWADPDETGLRALLILSHLRVAMSMSADPEDRARFGAAYDHLIAKEKYHWLTRNQKVMVAGSINHSDDELAFLAYYPLFMYERDPALLEVYRQSLERSWQIERPERNPLWNFIYAVGSGAKAFDRADSLRTLREIPLDQVQWSVSNAHRLDVPFDPMNDRFRRRQALVVLPYDELPMSKWNGNPYALEGGNQGRSEDDGTYFLLPYWMGRFHRLIDQ